eukprot:SM000132S26886  [mRNA]  locus=s132:201563:204725:- [translate_table: standard]
MSRAFMPLLSQRPALEAAGGGVSPDVARLLGDEAGSHPLPPLSPPPAVAAAVGELLFGELGAAEYEQLPSPARSTERDLQLRPFVGLVGNSSSATHVGRRRGILVRPDPRPETPQMAAALRLLAVLHEGQRRAQGVWPQRRALHMTGLIAALHSVRAPLLWLVVEDSQRSNDTVWLLASSGLPYVHLRSGTLLSSSDQDDGSASASGTAATLRGRELRMRERALRYIRVQRLEGVVVFADDSNVYTPSFFEAAQRVKAFAIVSAGVLLQVGFNMDSSTSSRRRSARSRALLQVATQPELEAPVQGAVCGANRSLLGLHVVLPRPPYTQISFNRADMEWASYVLDAGILWRTTAATRQSSARHVLPHEAAAPGGRHYAGVEVEMQQQLQRRGLSEVALPRATSHQPDAATTKQRQSRRYRRPPWVRDSLEWLPEQDDNCCGEPSAADFDLLGRVLLNESRLEVLGKCGSDVLLWWMRAEARADSKWPARWYIDPPLPVVVAAKSTPWPEPTSERPPTARRRPGQLPKAKLGDRRSRRPHGRASRRGAARKKQRQREQAAVKERSQDEEADMDLVLKPTRKGDQYYDIDGSVIVRGQERAQRMPGFGDGNSNKDDQFEENVSRAGKRLDQSRRRERSREGEEAGAAETGLLVSRVHGGRAGSRARQEAGQRERRKAAVAEGQHWFGGNSKAAAKQEDEPLEDSLLAATDAELGAEEAEDRAAAQESDSLEALEKGGSSIRQELKSRARTRVAAGQRPMQVRDAQAEISDEVETMEESEEDALEALEGGVTLDSISY